MATNNSPNPAAATTKTPNLFQFIAAAKQPKFEKSLSSNTGSNNNNSGGENEDKNNLDKLRPKKANSQRKSTAIFVDGTELDLKSTKSQFTKESVEQFNEHLMDDEFCVEKHVYWAKNEDVPFASLVGALQHIEDNSGRLIKIKVLTNYLHCIIAYSPAILVKAIFILLNQVAPAYEGIELGVGDQLMRKAAADITGIPIAKLRTRIEKYGDLGLVLENEKKAQNLLVKPKPLYVSQVFDKLFRIASQTGSGSSQQKTNIIKELLMSAQNKEGKFLCRILLNKLRIGLAEKTILTSLAHAFMLHREGNCEKENLQDAAETLREVFAQCPSYSHLISALMDENCSFDNLQSKCQLILGVPIQPMLAHPSHGIDEVFKRFEGVDVTCEYKYDGERAQIHLDEDNSVNVFSRNGETSTEKYPDVVSAMQELSAASKGHIKSLILDSEVVAFDIEQDKILPFQILTTRKRKGVSESEISVKLMIFVFDIIYLNGESLVKLSLSERRKHLESVLKESDKSKIRMVHHTDMKLDADALQEYLEQSITDSCEGLMIKTLNKSATYEISKRSRSWLKLKKDYLNNLGDSLDLVVIGAYNGVGKRSGMFGGFLLACYNEGILQAVCKCGTGLSDQLLKDLYGKYKEKVSELSVKQKPNFYECPTELDPDVWFEPNLIWEIKAADYSLSPLYTAARGLIDKSKGISLRFPRLIRERADKNWQQATQASQLADMYRNQQVFAEKPKQMTSERLDEILSDGGSFDEESISENEDKK